MGIRQVTIVVAAVVLIGGLSSCGGGDSAVSDATNATVAPTSAAVATTAPATSSTTAATTTVPPVDSTAAPTTLAASRTLVALAPETDGERAALVAAASDEGRRWAAGAAGGPDMAAGDPFLGGYVVFFSDGVTGYNVVVLNGAVAPYFGPNTDIIVSGPDYQTATMPAQTPRQQEAVAAGLAEIVTANAAATTADILAYVIYFPKVADSVDPAFSGSYPHVRIFANDVNGTIAQGGSEIR